MVYCLTCKSSSSEFVWQTSQILKICIDEQKAAVEHEKLEVTAVAEHVREEKYEIDFQYVSVTAQEANIIDV